MSIIPGSTIVTSDYVSTSSGAGDSGKVPILDTFGAIPAGMANGPRAYVTFGETIAAGIPVFVAQGNETISQQPTGSLNGQDDAIKDNNNRRAQTFTVPSACNTLKSVTYGPGKVGSPTGTLYWEIYAVDGSHFPTGAALAQVTQALSGSIGGTITFNLAVTPGTEYALVIYTAGGTLNGSNYIQTPIYNQSVTSIGYWSSSTNSGSSWAGGVTSTQFNSVLFSCTGYTQGRVYRTSAGTTGVTFIPSTGFAYQFCGFTVESGTAGQSKRIQCGGLITGLSGLTPGVTYYLANALGTLGSTQGTNYERVGLALSATSLIVMTDPVA